MARVEIQQVLMKYEFDDDDNFMSLMMMNLVNEKTVSFTHSLKFNNVKRFCCILIILYLTDTLQYYLC
jgi:hypothetical protein